MRVRTIDGLYVFIFFLLTYSCGVAIVFVGVQGIQQGHFNVGHLISFLLYLGYLSVPVRGFAEAPVTWQGQLGAAKRVMEVLDAPPPVKEQPGATKLQVTSGAIDVQNITFAYDADTPIFKNTSFRIDGGETVALVGPSGSGKSTLARLLMRFYDPQSGTVCVDRTDIRKVTLDSLRRSIAVVWQEPFFIDDTIEANLRLADPGAAMEQIQGACESAFIWEFINTLEQGLQTRLGSDGVELSAGQRQRLSIAQAFLRDAPILILDEASSALDSRSEQAIVQALQRLRQGRTTLIIAHRYSSIRMADRILYLNGDGTVCIGTHEELVKRHTGYREALAWQTQAGISA
jgi:ABC-type multidrug transport system fused ATPase/permease subunit